MAHHLRQRRPGLPPKTLGAQAEHRTTCSLDSPGAFSPTHHSWLSHGVEWVRFGDGLPTFQQWRNDNAV